MKSQKSFIRFLLLPAAIAIAAGCASTSTPGNTRVLKAYAVSVASTTLYNTVTVVPFELSPDVRSVDSNFGENFSGDIVAQLKTDYSGVFKQVHWKKPEHKAGELIVSGAIYKYDPGSMWARAWIGWGKGAANFAGEMAITDGRDGRVLLSVPFENLWAWGGTLGTRRSIDNLVAQTSIAIAKTVALWKEGKLHVQ